MVYIYYGVGGDWRLDFLNVLNIERTRLSVPDGGAGRPGRFGIFTCGRYNIVTTIGRDKDTWRGHLISLIADIMSVRLRVVADAAGRPAVSRHPVLSA